MKSFLHTLHHLFLGTAVVAYFTLAFASVIGLLTHHFLVPTPQPYSDWLAAANAVLAALGALGAYGFWQLARELEATDQLAAFHARELQRNAENDEAEQFAYDAFGYDAFDHDDWQDDWQAHGDAQAFGDAQDARWAANQPLKPATPATPATAAGYEEDYSDLYGPEIMLLLAERYPARYRRPTQGELDEQYADMLIARQKEEQNPNY